MPHRRSLDPKVSRAVAPRHGEGEGTFARELFGLRGSAVLSVETAEDPRDLPPVPGRIDVTWMQTLHGAPGTFATLPLGEVRLVAAMLPPSLLEGPADPDRAVVWWAMDTPHRAVGAGVPLGVDTLFFVGPGTRHQAYWPAQAAPLQTAVGLALPSARVPPGWPDAGPLPAQHLVEPARLDLLRTLTRRAFRRASEDPDSLLDPVRRATLGDDLVDVLTDLYRTATPVVDRRAALKRRYVETLDRIDRLVAANLDRPIGLEDAAEELRLAPRSVHNVMTLLRGMTLQTYVKIYRLRSLRRHLLDGERVDLVKQVAFHHGYANHGRMAQDYVRFFGELPSATLARRKR